MLPTPWERRPRTRITPAGAAPCPGRSVRRTDEHLRDAAHVCRRAS